MKKQYRLLKSPDFKKVIEARHRIKNESFSIYVKANELDHVRIGISTSKKLGNAVTRVKIRRQIRACFDLLDIFDYNYDIVVVAHLGFLTQGFALNCKLLNEAIATLTKRR